MARSVAHLTQEELADQTYSKSYISAVERGKMLPSLSALRLLTERLGVPIAYFLGEGTWSPARLYLKSKRRRKREQCLDCWKAECSGDQQDSTGQAAWQ